MEISKLFWNIVVVSIMVLATCLAYAQDSPLAESRQLLVVTTPDWNSIHGTLQRYERTQNGWEKAGTSIPVVIGRSGLGWGDGIAIPSFQAGEPVKREGDGRSPAGVFTLGSAFGFAVEKPDWLKLSYIPLTSATECVDDVNSEYYDSIVDRVPSVKPDWNSSEKMRQINGYHWGVVVNHNHLRQPGHGSCIFLHIWSGLDNPTAGCTAMQQDDLEAVMKWLDPAEHPVLVALPSTVYERLRSQWKLP